MIDPDDRIVPPRPVAGPSLPRPGQRARSWWGRWLRRVILALALFILCTSLWVLIYRIVPPPVTPLMIIRWVENGDAPQYDFVAGAALPDTLKRAVLAAEDARFCMHHGFDWKAIEQAWERNQSGKRLRGGSTISMQTAKNVFLWHGETRWARWLRKGFEAYFTLLIEYVWGKERILELYLNVAEWGPGIYGAEAAAQYHFNKPASQLSRREAALLAAILPNPLRWSAAKPGAYITKRAATIQARSGDLPDYRDGRCTESGTIF